MPDLKDAFDWAGGDLLYGQSRDRGAALKYLYENHATGFVMQDLFEAGAWVTVDNFNAPLAIDYALQPPTWGQQIVDLIDGTEASVTNELQAKQGNLSDLDKEEAARFQKETDAFIRALASHKYSPLEVADASRDKIRKEGWQNAGESLAKDLYYLAIRRACKFGIEYVAGQSHSGNIHFILNRFDQGSGWQETVRKQPVLARGRTSVIITYSELRYVFRNWNRFRGRIHFYRIVDGVGKVDSIPSCLAPWEDGATTVPVQEPGQGGMMVTRMISLRELWTEYPKQRFLKYMARLTELIRTQAARYNQRKMQIDNEIDLAGIVAGAGDYETAPERTEMAIGHFA